MPLDDARDLLAVLADHDLLPKARLEGVCALAGAFPKAANLARELARRGVLTPFQVNEIFNSRAAGLVLGQYLLLDRLGAGGMGQVFKARHRVLDRLVALKVIRDEYVSRPEAVERFRRECRAAARLSHPNIILVHDAHQAGAVHFLAMEYVEGKDLGRVLKERGPLPAAEACEYARQAALGLQHAHERGLVHRDVKPANLILTADGATVKVLDLGLARLRAAPGAAEADSGLTRDGAIMGTPDYLPPEQAGGDSGLADARADVYSLGCTLYHLIAGRPPFTGQTQGQKIAAHLTQEAPSLDRVRPGVPVGLPAVVRRMMAKEPAARFPTAAATAAALAPFCRKAATAATLSAAPPMATPLAPSAARTAVPAGRPSEAIPIGSTLPQTPSIGRPPTAASASTVAWRRPVGRKRFVAAAAGLFVVGLAALLLWRLAPSGGRGTTTPDRPVASKDADPTPDHRDGPAKVVNPVPVVPVVENLPPPPKHVPTRDGVAWPSPDCVALLGDDGGRHWGEVDAVAFRPDGKIIAAADRAAGKAFIHLWDAETLRERAAWAPAGGIVQDMAFSPDGRRFAAACGDGVRLWDAGPDGLSGVRLFGAPGPSSTNIFHLLFTADGQFLLTWDAAGAVRRWRLTKGAPEEDGDPAPGPKNPNPLAISADGRVEAYCRYEAATRKTLVCVRGLLEKDGNERTVELSTGAGRLALSADGKRLAAMVGSLGAGELRVWDLDGGDPRPRETVDLAKIGVNDSPSQFAFTPDGGRVVLGVSPRAGKAGVWLIDATSGDATKLDGLDVSPKCVACAADGKAVAVVGRDNRLRLWEDRGKGFTARPSGPAAAGVARRLAFRPGGADLAVVSRLNDKDKLVMDGNTDLSNLVVWDWAKGEARQTFTCGGWFGDGAYSPDGARLFVGGSAPGRGGPGEPFHAGFLRVWRADTLKEEAPPNLPKELGDGPIDVVTFDREGKTLALLGGNEWEQRRACVCDPWPFRTRGKSFAVGSQVVSLALTPDGATAAVLGARGQGFMAVPVVKWWDVTNLDSGPAKEVVPANPLEGAARETARRLTFSPDGGTLAALVATGPFSGDAQTILLWDVKTGRTRAPAVGMGKQAPQVEALAFSPDGRTLATAGADGRVSLWRADALTPARTWEFPGPATAVAFSPDGGYLAVGDGDGTVAILKLTAK